MGSITEAVLPDAGRPGGPGGPGDRILFWPQVKGIVPFSRSTVWRMQRTGAFPLSVQVSPGRVGWWESELLVWTRSRLPHRLPEARPFEDAAALASRRRPGGPAVKGASSGYQAVRVETPASDAPISPVASAAPHGGRSRHARRSNGSPDQIAFDFGA